MQRTLQSPHHHVMQARLWVTYFTNVPAQQELKCNLHSTSKTPYSTLPNRGQPLVCTLML